MVFVPASTDTPSTNGTATPIPPSTSPPLESVSPTPLTPSTAAPSISIPAASSAFVSSPPEETEKEETTSSVSSDTVSSMGFDFSSYYQDKSSMPIHIEKPKTRWMSGPDPLCKYMNDVYIPLTMNHSSDKDKMIIYAKRGTTGIAGQISGMCDVLLLGILNDRVFKCLCCPWQ